MDVEYNFLLERFLKFVLVSKRLPMGIYSKMPLTKADIAVGSD